MDWREKMQRSIDNARSDSGVTEPERIFMTDDVSTIPFERAEWTKLRDHRWLMDHFDLVMEIKRAGLFVAGDLIPTSINGYSVKPLFEVTPPEIVYEGCVDVHFCIMLSDVHGGYTGFNKRMIFDLNGRECDDFFKTYVGNSIRETFEQLLLQVCRRANEIRKDEMRGLQISGRIVEILSHTFFSRYNGRISKYDLFEIKLKPYEGGIYNGKFQIYR